MSADVGTAQKLGAEKVSDEIVDMMAGPGVHEMWHRMVPSEAGHLTPLIYKLMLNERPSTIKALLQGGNAGQSVMNDLVRQSVGNRG